MRILIPIRNLQASQSGASMIEYAVLLGVVLAVALGAFVIIGKKVDSRFSTVANSICENASTCP